MHDAYLKRLYGGMFAPLDLLRCAPLQTTAFEPKTLSSTLGYPFADFTPTASRRYVSKLLNDAPG